MGKSRVVPCESRQDPRADLEIGAPESTETWIRATQERPIEEHAGFDQLGARILER